MSSVDRGQPQVCDEDLGGNAAPQFPVSRYSAVFLKSFTVLATRVLHMGGELLSPRFAPLSRTYRRIFANRRYYPSPALT